MEILANGGFEDHSVTPPNAGEQGEVPGPWMTVGEGADLYSRPPKTAGLRPTDPLFTRNWENTQKAANQPTPNPADDCWVAGAKFRDGRTEPFWQSVVKPGAEFDLNRQIFSAWDSLKLSAELLKSRTNNRIPGGYEVFLVEGVEGMPNKSSTSLVADAWLARPNAHKVGNLGPVPWDPPLWTRYEITFDNPFYEKDLNGATISIAFRPFTPAAGEAYIGIDDISLRTQTLKERIKDELRVAETPASKLDQALVHRLIRVYSSAHGVLGGQDDGPSVVFPITGGPPIIGPVNPMHADVLIGLIVDQLASEMRDSKLAKRVQDIAQDIIADAIRRER